MKRICPYCAVVFSMDGVSADHCFPHFQAFHPHGIYHPQSDDEKDFTITSHRCPECYGQVMWLNELGPRPVSPTVEREIKAVTLLYPKFPITTLPPEVPEGYANEFRQAAQTLDISPKASAALSRRCLQALIREKAAIQRPSLFEEIRLLLDRRELPKHLADDLDAIRAVGNFAAHPVKDTNTAEIVDVEPGEAEWTLEVLRELLLFYFVDERKSLQRRDGLNEKLRRAGKPPLQK